MSDSTLMAMAERFLSALKHCQLLQMRVVQTNANGMTLVLPWSAAIVGNPQTGAVHGGALTTLMDTTCGMATLCVLPRFEVCPTLDLRIDYMHPAKAGKDIYGHAQCYRVTRDVIFTRGTAYQDDPAQPICQVVGTFMRLGQEIKGGIRFGNSLKEGGA
ncbi:thioesterase [Pseudomonas putida]|uniref:Thioesterase n=2 Tax=Pseudomonas TaxID=286 RepID=A0A0N8HG87_PSEPU|nr:MULTISPECIES: PaaI family thioesterase [Pseudomonas]KPM66284.1 thioesterase [Pseudomonas putida]MBA6108981.1 PaaI family thioesterase [Pseudomonas asiatica]MDM9599629.1 PaaI family thioesterase [Pseudomonas shirazica]MDO2413057.1 PaaI family thioesterase [Pseudomonas shirazica]MDS9593058.1 PaaI family thioesterase [Pseudomonas sp. HTZ1]